MSSLSSGGQKPESKVLAGPALFEGSRGELLHAALSAPTVTAGHLCLSLQCLPPLSHGVPCVFTLSPFWHVCLHVTCVYLSLCLFSFFFKKATSHTGLRASFTLVWPDLNLHLNHICRDPFPNKVMSTGTRGQGLDISFGDTTQPTRTLDKLLPLAEPQFPYV